MLTRIITLPLQIAAAAGLGYFGVTLATQPQTSTAVVQASSEILAIASDAVEHVSNCNIKGNISINSGERIYHVPGQRYYSETNISLQHGERWFCSETEAQAAGWRRSRQ